MANNSLVLFSGGADSSYLAYKLLTETTDNITLLAIATKKGRGQALPLKKAAMLKNVITELKKIRDFNFKLEVIDQSDIPSFTFDLKHNFAVYLYKDRFNSGEFDNFITGSSFEQNDGWFYKNNVMRGIPSYTEAKYIFETLCTRGNFLAPFVTNDYHENYSRYDLMKHIPDNIRRCTVACLSDTSENCGVCSKCLFDKKATEAIAKGWTSANFTEWRRERSQYYGGGNGRDVSAQSWIFVEEGVPFNRPSGISNGVQDTIHVITNKEEFDIWYDTVEYTIQLDTTLRKWGLTKEAWSFPPAL